MLRCRNLRHELRHGRRKQGDKRTVLYPTVEDHVTLGQLSRLSEGLPVHTVRPPKYSALDASPLNRVVLGLTLRLGTPRLVSPLGRPLRDASCQSSLQAT